MADPELREIVAAELAEPVDPRVTAMAAALAAEYPDAARAVLFYGSCLRQRELDGLMLDFYLIVSDYRDAYRKKRLIVANTLIPPNVFPFAHEGLIAKYAVLSEADFARECSFEADSVSVWARFAQPSRLVWASDDAARDRAINTVAQAAPILLALAMPANPGVFDPLEIWRRGFDLTYRAELRAEKTTRAASIVDTDPDRYRRFFLPAMSKFDLPLRKEGGGQFRALWVNDRRAERNIERRWKRRQFRGKLRSLVRLAKATTTFAGGVDYIAWKINRHAGTEILVKPWMRRWPILGALTLLPRLWRRGAIR